MAFPANNFGKQEPGSNAEIQSFCTNTMNVSFDLFAKISVLGEHQAPLYKYLTDHADESITGEVKWNFEKYLVGRDGTVLAKFGTRTLPQDPKVIEQLEKVLAKKVDDTGS